uniref:Cytochrome b6-f complex subunit 7 n=1 Tax=Anthurium amnicola TaxID=1678845 RepID=A0A1D1Y707_9ARAE
MATLSPAVAALGSAGLNCSMRRKATITYVGGLSSFGGLKAHNNVASLGLPECADRSFARVAAALRSPSQGTGKGGGALASTCNAADEIFRIAAIMNALVLVGVAVGFVLLRVEASLEEAE